MADIKKYVIDRDIEIFTKSGIRYGGTCVSIDEDWIELEDDKDKKFVRVSQIEAFMIKLLT